ncbi:hypothetical protein JOQ06_016591 [Pogonophryne albipinna]|uniref:Uncharacterized protein n=1 Tax=Pogonophryne albipinna TaxID=1090488 RepID=A0AAD6F672_9TELE|nr:hypothetical protein JOQ06_016591 [Pogonophryne albipinna]
MVMFKENTKLSILPSESSGSQKCPGSPGGLRRSAGSLGSPGDLQEVSGDHQEISRRSQEISRRSQGSPGSPGG